MDRLGHLTLESLIQRLDYRGLENRTPGNEEVYEMEWYCWVSKKSQREARKGGEYVDIFSRNNTREGKLGLKEVKEKMCRIQDELTMELSSGALSTENSRTKSQS